VWELVGSPTRYPEWWPRVIEVQGQRFDEGDEFAQVIKDPFGGKAESNFLLERRENLREISMTCQLTGMHALWLLTEAQGGTFVEVEIGMRPRRVGDMIFDKTLGNSYFRRWTSQSLEGLRKALLRQPKEKLGG
jgi:hypothetical protein